MGLFSRGSAEPPAALDLPYDPVSHDGLAARWVRWAASVGIMHNPISDTTGEDAAIGQPDDVWFLAGTFGTAATRTITVPAGVPLFLPAINMWFFPATGPAEPLGDAFGQVQLDGEDIATVAIATPVPFLVEGARFNPVTQTRKPIPTTVSGIWAFVEPPARGEHVLRVTGGDGHGFELDLTVRLTVGG